MATLRTFAWSYRTLGRRLTPLLLSPLVAYFFLRERASRAASRRYLTRIWELPEGRGLRPQRPGPLAPFRHYHEFAVQGLDRMARWGGSAEREKGAEALAQAYVRRLEDVCLRYPYQWFNFYDVWESRGDA
jgi:predicted LPLAT superfamily acyltransferase